MSLLVYEWERQKFPHEQEIAIPPDIRARVCSLVCEVYGIEAEVRLSLLRGDSGRASVSSGVIRLPSHRYTCNLGTILHEVAHILNWKINRAIGHQGTWKHVLIKVYIEMRLRIDPIIKRAWEEVERDRASATIRAEREMARAKKKAEKKAFRNSREQKIVRLETRIKRLETRQKRIGTLLKNARRSLTMHRIIDVKLIEAAKLEKKAEA